MDCTRAPCVMASSKIQSGKNGLLIAGVLGMVFFAYTLRKCSVTSREVRSRPWAYSSDPTAQLLIGTWQGSFKDPAGVEKRLSLEFFVPLTEEELEDKASFTRRRRRVRTRDLRSFDGVASIQSSLGQEIYTFFGSVDASDFHRLALDFTPEDESKRVLPNYTARTMSDGKWESDSLTAKLVFTHHDADGFSRSSSEGVVENGQLVWKENADEKPVEVSLKRMKAL